MVIAGWLENRQILAQNPGLSMTALLRSGHNLGFIIEKKILLDSDMESNLKFNFRDGQDVILVIVFSVERVRAKMRNISFIEAKSPETHIFSKFPIPRLGSLILGTILKKKGYEVKVYIEDFERPDWSFVENSDLVCISTITSTAFRAYEIADKLRTKNIPVVMGGAHPTFVPDESLKHSDYVVRQEGDITLPELLSYLESGNPPLTSILGLSYKDKNDAIMHNPSRPLIEDLDNLPEPDLSLIPNWNLLNLYPVSTSRGCPFDCSFCSVIEMFGRKYRSESVEATLRKLRHIAAISKSTIFFVDDNFTANKKRTKEILKGMIGEEIKRRWVAQARTDVAEDVELLRLMADSGCHTLHIGFESINPKTLEAYNKKQGVEEIRKCIRVVKDYGIHLHGMFVIGADTDDLDTIKNTVDFAIENHIDTVQLMMLTPLPGTPFFFEILNSKRLLHTNWSKFDGHHIVFKPNLMSPQTLHVKTLKAMRKFYSWKYIFSHLFKFDFYTMVGLFGKKAIRQALMESRRYLESIEIAVPYVNK